MHCTENEIIKTDESETKDDEVTVESTLKKSGRIRKAQSRFGYDKFADVVTVDHHENVLCDRATINKRGNGES